MDMQTWVTDNTIHKIWAGSRLYGTARPDSDWDLRGVCRMPPEALLGLLRFDQYQKHDEEEDTCIYGLTKFFALSLDANPNILDILCAPPQTWLLETPEWREIYDNRHLFLSQELRYTFSRYAVSQLKRLQRHYQWLTHPPDHKPMLEEFGGRLESDEKGGQKKVFPHLDARNRYEQAARHWKQYQTWLQERNPARAELERKYGYDTKHASHLVRLMLQVACILQEGDYNPQLQDGNLETVLSVLHGQWAYERLIAWADEADQRVRSMDSVLPERPARKQAEALLMSLNQRSLS
jgi:predicted nucleotidyltransferase